jgi:hypothetical protein
VICLDTRHRSKPESRQCGRSAPCVHAFGRRGDGKISRRPDADLPLHRALACRHTAAPLCAGGLRPRPRRASPSTSSLTRSGPGSSLSSAGSRQGESEGRRRDGCESMACAVMAPPRRTRHATMASRLPRTLQVGDQVGPTCSDSKGKMDISHVWSYMSGLSNGET